MATLTPGLDGVPVTDKHRLVSIRAVTSDPERQMLARKLQTGWAHVRPHSVLVCVIGNHYAFGSWNRIVDMVQRTNAEGICCSLSEIQDRCMDPYDALGTMRNEAMLSAQVEGYEFLCYCDSDIQPEPDTLLKLLSWHTSPVQPSILAPLVVEPGTGRKLHGPTIEPYSGLHIVKWTVLSMLLFRTTVFNCVGPRFWGDAVGADEGYHFQTLYYYGHRPYIDSNVQLVVSGRPHYPLATNRFTYAQRQEHWDSILRDMQKPPDRRPVDPNSPYVVDGEYLPFALPGQPQVPNGQPVAPDTGTALAPLGAFQSHSILAASEPGTGGFPPPGVTFSSNAGEVETLGTPAAVPPTTIPDALPTESGGESALQGEV